MEKSHAVKDGVLNKERRLLPAQLVWRPAQVALRPSQCKEAKGSLLAVGCARRSGSDRLKTIN
ncbi:hypothetical protein A2U01_0058792 [Trifolium medium]|uniref:Uncharacterized protein n=1 Tax=Trifolium medium TaxID=97028 RepID=A0A392RLS1_9FABA|nr:hypothetical protein [Trifolium medium]